MRFDNSRIGPLQYNKTMNHRFITSWENCSSPSQRAGNLDSVSDVSKQEMFAADPGTEFIHDTVIPRSSLNRERWSLLLQAVEMPGVCLLNFINYLNYLQLQRRHHRIKFYRELPGSVEEELLTRLDWVVCDCMSIVVATHEWVAEFHASGLAAVSGPQVSGYAKGANCKKLERVLQHLLPQYGATGKQVDHFIARVSAGNSNVFGAVARDGHINEALLSADQLANRVDLIVQLIKHRIHNRDDGTADPPYGISGDSPRSGGVPMGLIVEIVLPIMIGLLIGVTLGSLPDPMCARKLNRRSRGARLMYRGPDICGGKATVSFGKLNAPVGA